jgi:hypothetical protein
MARYSAEEKNEVHSALAATLDGLAAAGREPDTWEEDCLVRAINYVESGNYLLAKGEVTRFFISPENRPIWQASQLAKNPRRYNLARLKVRFESARRGAG